jgi:uncharacterized protein (DUF433 family)
MVRNEISDEELIATYLEPSSRRRGLAETWLKESTVPVWALIGHLPAVDYDITRLADEYDISLAEAEAALAFYERHKAVIDARIAANDPELP